MLSAPPHSSDKMTAAPPLSSAVVKMAVVKSVFAGDCEMAAVSTLPGMAAVSTKGGPSEAPSPGLCTSNPGRCDIRTRRGLYNWDHGTTGPGVGRSCVAASSSEDTAGCRRSTLERTFCGWLVLLL
ncbi:unnamed protein product [Lampetra planeri]